MKTKKHRMYVVTEVNNGGTGLEILTSKKPISWERVTQYYTKRGFDWERDGITRVEPEPINLDK